MKRSWDRTRANLPVLMAGNVPLSKVEYDRPAGDQEDGSTLGELFLKDETTPFDVLLRKRKIEAVRNALRKMPERDAYIVGARYGIIDIGHPGVNGLAKGEATLDFIGDRLGLTRERVRQLQNAAMARLRALLAGAA